MYTNGFNTEGLFTMPVVEKKNELNRYCKLEGMDYQHLIYETHELKSFLGRIKHSVIVSGIFGNIH